MFRQIMNINKRMVCGVISLLSVCMLSFSVHARTLIFQSSGNDQGSAPAASSTPQQASANPDPLIGNQPMQAVSTDVAGSANSELFFMLEQLQQEVNTLRGIIEEQGHELRTLKQNSRDRYVDLDSRVLDLTKRISSVSKSSAASNPDIGTPVSATPVTPQVNNQKLSDVTPLQGTANDVPSIPQREPSKEENEAYSSAYNFIKDKKFDDAILALFSYTENYPDSPLLPNVYYWLGEVYLATSKLEQAKTSFSLVLTAYPDSPKVSDALYKLAVTLDRLGEKSQAKQYLAEVQKNYPNTSAAKLAKNYTLTP